MEYAERMIEGYQSISVVCAGGAAVCLLVLLVCIGKFRIFRVWNAYRGKTAKRAVARMRKAGSLCLMLVAGCWLGSGNQVQAAAVQTTNVQKNAVQTENAQEVTVQTVKVQENGEWMKIAVTVRDKELGKDDLTFFLRAEDACGQAVPCTEAEAVDEKSWAALEQMEMEQEETGQELPFALVEKKGVCKLELCLTTEAVYTLEVQLREEARIELGTYCLDRTGPQITVSYDEAGRPNGDITWEAKEQTFWEKVIHEVTFGYFCKPELDVHIRAKDHISGIAEIQYIYEGVQGEELEAVCVTENASTENNLLTEESGSCASVSFTLPGTFRGTIRAAATDRAGYTMEAFAETVPILAESEETHERCSSAKLLSVEGEGKKPSYYRSDVTFAFQVQDTFSGIRKVSFGAGESRQEKLFEEQGAEAVTESSLSFTVEAVNWNQNQISIAAYMQDFAGHKTPAEGLSCIHIDTAAPKVEVHWDNQDVAHGIYYKAERKATILVRERNFDPEDIQLTVTGMDVPQLTWNHQPGSGCGGSKDANDLGHVDSCVWSSQVAFTQDGRYTFAFSCVDAAGNRGSYGKIDTFVIDKTPPVLRVSWNPAAAVNGMYYSQKRNAVAEVVDANFAPEDGVIWVEIPDTENAQAETTSGVVPAAPTPGAFVAYQTGVFRAGVDFSNDGTFRLCAQCTDLAGNVSELYDSGYFVIDQTPPQITFSGITDRAANAEEAKLEVLITDENLDAGKYGMQWSACQEKGTLPSFRAEETQTSCRLVWEDFAWIPENDDLYSLSIRAVDLAGNETDSQVHFSVNRFGSVYQMEEETKELAGEGGFYFTSREPELLVSEYNPDMLMEKQVVVSREGEWQILEENVDYAVTKTGETDTWKCWTYQIFSQNFEREGMYTVLITSVDQAGNASSNEMKGAGLSFVVDKTAPEIRLLGVKEGGQYRTRQQAVNIEIQDMCALKEAVISRNGKVEQVIEEEELLSRQGKLTFFVPEEEDWQTLTIIAQDKAGNSSEEYTLQLLVNERAWIQFLRNRKALWLTAGVLLVCITALGGLWCKRNTCNRKSM